MSWARLLGAALALVLAGCARFPLAAVPGGATVSLPVDHAPHAEAQTEWWHVHAELEDLQTGEPVYLFAAFLVQRTDRDSVGPLPVSLGVNPFHVAMVKVQTRDRVWVADRSNFPDLVAARFVGDGLDLRHGDWRIAWEAGAFVLDVGTGRHAMSLRLVPTQAATLPGEGGRVELQPGAAHMWVQQERMSVEGSWQDGRDSRWVAGSGFVKHQWGRLYDDELDGFEWISLDLPSSGSLSIAWLHDDGMRGVPGSQAWLSVPGRDPIALPASQLSLQPTRTWRSRRSATRWPVAWSVSAPGVELEIEALRDDQELWVFPAAIYAGPARVRGEVLGEPVDVVGFVEQVGARPSHLRFLLRSEPPPPPLVAASGGVR